MKIPNLGANVLFLQLSVGLTKVYTYPTLPPADAAPITGRPLGSSFILKLKYCQRLSLYISPHKQL